MTEPSSSTPSSTYSVEGGTSTTEVRPRTTPLQIINDEMAASQGHDERIIVWDTSAYSYKAILVLDWSEALVLRDFITALEAI